jgi:methanogenic corrinoid protein MtbC1
LSSLFGQGNGEITTSTFLSGIEFRRRTGIAGAIRAVRSPVAEEVTNAFLARHPEWKERYGDRARQFGIQDAGYHQDFLAAAIETGELETFRDYGVWAARMLMARDIAPGFLAENLEQVGQALRIRLSEPEADIVDSFIRAGIEGCLQGEGKEEPALAGQLEQLTRMYADAAIRGGRPAALNLMLGAVRQGHAVLDLYEVLQRAMYRIGRLWQENKITVAQEHMATAITQFVIAHLYTLIEPQDRFRGRIVITGVQGELHQVGANMVADVLEANGWDVRFLGCNVPIGGALEAIDEHKADLLGISSTMPFHVSSVASLIDSVRAKGARRIRILLGGGAFRSAPLLYKEIGADGYADDLRSAVALANELIGSGLDKGGAVSSFTG